MSGYVTTLVELDREDDYIWSPMPQLNLQLHNEEFVTETIKICGGYAYGCKIKLFSIAYRKTKEREYAGVRYAT